ncbi:MAG: hypothetical protein GY800_12595 [Planctomycetes bacterium]|nr:hypothetical protein [Planctomycetota bacterium]
MNKIALLVFFMVSTFCVTSHADVITLTDGSVFEGTVYEQEELGYSFSVDGGIVVLLRPFVASVENRTLTENERGRLIKFKTNRYDVTIKLGSLETGQLTPFEEEVMGELTALTDVEPAIPYPTILSLVAEKFNLPVIIVLLIDDKWL